MLSYICVDAVNWERKNLRVTEYREEFTSCYLRLLKQNLSIPVWTSVNSVSSSSVSQMIFRSRKRELAMFLGCTLRRRFFRVIFVCPNIYFLLWS